MDEGKGRRKTPREKKQDEYAHARVSHAESEHKRNRALRAAREHRRERRSVGAILRQAGSVEDIASRVRDVRRAQAAYKDSGPLTRHLELTRERRFVQELTLALESESPTLRKARVGSLLAEITATSMHSRCLAETLEAWLAGSLRANLGWTFTAPDEPPARLRAILRDDAELRRAVFDWISACGLMPRPMLSRERRVRRGLDDPDWREIEDKYREVERELREHGWSKVSVTLVPALTRRAVRHLEELLGRTPRRSEWQWALAAGPTPREIRAALDACASLPPESRAAWIAARIAGTAGEKPRLGQAPKRSMIGRGRSVPGSRSPSKRGP